MKIKQVLAFFAVGLLSLSAIAGYLQPAPVQISFDTDGSGIAGGDMVSARFADNDVEVIGCGSTRFAGGYAWGFCQATAADGTQVTCFTDDAALLEQMRSTGDFSYIAFSWDPAGTCTSFRFSTQSFYIPEFTDKKDKK